MNDDKRLTAFKNYVKELNREVITDDEYPALAACDAHTDAYNLDCYPTPPAWERFERNEGATRTGGIFLSEGGQKSCRG